MSELLYSIKNAYEVFGEEKIKSAYDYCEGYKIFIDKSKTERLGIAYSIELAKRAGFIQYEDGEKYSAGDKVYFTRKDKAAAFAVIGTESMEKGFNITAAHMDCPRLDLKPNPLYEDGSLALFKTHYYGGIKKYQWVARPLMICGVVYKKDGTKIDICLGDKDDDAVYFISDILPHLGKNQGQKKLGEAISGEELNVIIGSSFDKDDEKNKIKTKILKILNQKYNITEEDFLTSEIYFVPATHAKDVGLDKSLLGAYGHDDRVCSYTAFTSLLEAAELKKTAVAVFADKEEVGSMGITGLRSRFMDYFLEGLCESAGVNPRIAYANSSCLSADVAAGYDPTFSDVYEKNNSAYLNCGFAITKYTGHGGKSNASEASPDFVAKLCNIFDKAGALYQFSEMGKVDAGGGGTVAQFVADKNIEVLDVGVPLLAMHAPYELASKTDIYSLHLGIKAFYEQM